MRKSLKIVLAVLLIGIWCIGNALSCGASSQEQWLLNTERIIDGFDNITVNEDGSWTVTGDFSLSFPVSYDYRMEQYYLIVQSDSDGTYDLEVDFAVSEETVYPVFLAEEFFGTALGNDTEDLRCLFYFDQLYQYNRLTGVWQSSNYQVQCTTLTYHADTATRTTFKVLEYCSAKYSLFGDVNDDGKTDTADVRELLFAILGRESGMLYNIDIDGDSTLSTADARDLLKIIVE